MPIKLIAKKCLFSLVQKWLLGDCEQNGLWLCRSCIRAQLDTINISEDDVNRCMGDSSADTTHDLLEVGLPSTHRRLLSRDVPLSLI
jgi:hypothetical protein